MGGVKTISIIVAANIKGLEAGLGKANKSIAGFASQAARVGSMLTFGVTAPLTAMGKQAFDTFSNFENSMMKVNAVTGATTEEFKMLTKEAKRLGSTTQFTASQVADLQLILGRKGFNPDAIQGMTESILDLALATGEDLSLASEVVSASINAFNLEAEDAARISNTLASAASDSSIQLNTFATAFGHAGASANAVGVNIEELSAMMGVLMDNGIKASKAGTGLRKIFMKLNETGTKFSSVLEEAAEGEMDLNRAQELVGTTAANQLLVLTDNLEKVNELSSAYATNTTKLKEMADLMGQTTFAKVKKLESAFEGFRLELGEVLSEMLMPMIETVTELFGEFGKLDRDTQKLIVTIGGIALAAGPVLIALGAMVALIPLLTTGFGVVAGAVATVGTALSALGLEVIAGSAIFASIASFADTLGDEARLKEQEAARNKAIQSQKGFMLSTWATHQALEAEAKALEEINKELDRQEKFKQEKAVDSAKAVPTLGAIAPTAISNVVQGTLINTTDAMQQMVDNFDAKTQAVKDTLTGFALDVGFAFSDAFAQMAVSGELSLKNLGNLFFDLLKAMAKMVIQALIMTAIFSALGVAPAGGAFAGQGMSGFKQTMLGMMGGSFANGGQPPLGKVSLVGEQGPELFVPSQKGTIIPNGGFGGSVIPDVRITGDDLLIVFDKAQRRKSRR
tara:strand:+ start:4481 stop:6529 length:2049 start_codon:yes stop_codon:yes gene_type:complete